MTTQSNTIWTKRKSKDVQKQNGTTFVHLSASYTSYTCTLQGHKKDDFELPACMKIAETVAIVGL